MDQETCDALVAHIQENEIDVPTALAAVAKFVETQGENAAVNHANSARADFYYELADDLKRKSRAVTLRLP